MGFDCGFDIHPVLQPTDDNKAAYQRFVAEVVRKYQNDPVSEQTPHVIKFCVGEHPHLPLRCEYFLRFSSKISGSCWGTQKYIQQVREIAKKYLDPSRIHYWVEESEAEPVYDWGEIYAKEKEERETRVESQKEE